MTEERDKDFTPEDGRVAPPKETPDCARQDEPAALAGAKPPRRLGRAGRGQGFFLWLVKYYAFAIIALLAHLGALAVAMYAHRSSRVPATPTRAEAHASAQALTRIYAGDGRLIGEFASEWRSWAPYADIPPLLVKAFLAVEDHRFLQHRGIDWSGLMRAAWINLRTGRFVQGGSTITQQLAKTYIGAERTVDRKIREAILATRIEASMSKPEILELYLNRIFLGHGAFGVSAAARRYFDKRLDQLSLAEMALVAGLARAPSRYNPFLHPKRALERRNLVLDRMMEHGYISRAKRDGAVKQGVTRDGSLDLGLRRRADFFHEEAPYFTDQVRREVIERFGKERFDRGGLRVETTVDTAVQAAARRNVDELARWVDKRQGWRGPAAYLGEEPDRERFRKESRTRYGEGPLQPGRRYLGLVEKVESLGAKVTVAGRPHTLPLRFLRWGARYYSLSAVNDRFVGHAWVVLMPGDVVWVRLAPPSGYDPLLPGSDDGPAASQPGYRKPLEYLHDGKPGLHVPPLQAPRGPDWPGPPYLALEQAPRVQAAVFALDWKTGYVQAMVGGTDYDRSNFNRVTQACRQPGSTYKPVYYSLALDRGMSFHKTLKDKPYSIVDPQTGRVWYATDYEHDPALKERFADKLAAYTKTLEQALVWSKNKASMSLFCELGPSSVRDERRRCQLAARDVKAWAQRLGFTTEIIADEALGLGASCTRTDELAQVFATFAAAGRRVEPVFIRRVLDRQGEVLLDRTLPEDPLLPPADRFDRLYATAGEGRPQVISPKTARRTSILLRRVVSHGHAEVLRMTKIPAAGKTGTSSRTADTWFVGHTSRWLVTAWLGDDHYERSLGRHDASFSTALPMWARFVYDTARFQPLRELPDFDAEGRPLSLTPVIPGEDKGIRKPDYEPPFKKRSTGAAASPAEG
ncbi:MAG: transglycosylase domain-containing protein [Polyangia bacterium]|jgi:penicillin-binding protein 1A|nr:transglycosylase domain-containing protein [Polyangia bacterium]